MGLFVAVEGFASWFYCRLSANVILGLAPVAAAALAEDAAIDGGHV